MVEFWPSSRDLARTAGFWQLAGIWPKLSAFGLLAGIWPELPDFGTNGQIPATFVGIQQQ
jgi:hypothetical protein